MHSCFAPLCSTTRCVENSSLVVAEFLVVLTGYGLCRKSVFHFPGFSILLGLMTQHFLFWDWKDSYCMLKPLYGILMHYSSY